MTDSNPDLLRDDHGIERCWWCGSDPEYIRYHDQEWGKPVQDDQTLFEKICLEGFQAGLSWLTILRKRERFREQFKNFDFEAVARFKQKDVNRLLKDAGIIRHRGKIESTINNAQRAIELREEFSSLGAYFWKFEPEESIHISSRAGVAAKTPESTALSKDLKKRGWSFVGPTTCYAFMQAMGMVNDHLTGCHHWQEIEKLRKKFKRPR